MFFFLLVSSCVLLLFRLLHFSNSFCWLLSFEILCAMNYCSVFVSLGSCAGREAAFTSWVLMLQDNLDPVKTRIGESGCWTVTVALPLLTSVFLLGCLTQNVVTHCSSWDRGSAGKSSVQPFSALFSFSLSCFGARSTSCSIPWCPGFCCQQLSCRPPACPLMNGPLRSACSFLPCWLYYQHRLPSLITSPVFY